MPARRTGSPGPPHWSQISPLRACAAAATPRACAGRLEEMRRSRCPRLSSPLPRRRPRHPRRRASRRPRRVRSGRSPARTGEDAVRVGLGVPGVERQAAACADGGVGCGECGSQRRQIDAHRGLWRPVHPMRTEFRSLFANRRKPTPPYRPAKPPRRGVQFVWAGDPFPAAKRPAAQIPSRGCPGRC